MFLKRRFYVALIAVAFVMAAGMLYAPLFFVGQILLLVLVALTVMEASLLYLSTRLVASRRCAERFSLGDDNPVEIAMASMTPFKLRLEVIDELPPQLQIRDFCLRDTIKRGERKTLRYTVRPTQRGMYEFGNILVFISTFMGLVQRRIICGVKDSVKVYPSFLRLRQFELMAATDNFSMVGIKRVRRVGNNTEFEQIKDYVKGDDYRTINWKATARRSQLMVNVYDDERSQQVFSVIDKGRLMQQSFLGMTLLDYAINASLVLSYVVVNKHDKAGLVTFAGQFDSYIPADRQTTQMHLIQESLYGQQTTFGESDFSVLCHNVNKLVTKRSLLVLYTNFIDYGSLNRQMQYLMQLNRRHRLLVVVFEDEELEDYIRSPHHDIEGLYQHVVAEKQAYEKRLIMNTLRQNGIYGLLTKPRKLTVDVINKYLEMKSRSLIG